MVILSHRARRQTILFWHSGARLIGRSCTVELLRLSFQYQCLRLLQVCYGDLFGDNFLKLLAYAAQNNQESDEVFP